MRVFATERTQRLSNRKYLQHREICRKFSAISDISCGVTVFNFPSTLGVDVERIDARLSLDYEYKNTTCYLGVSDNAEGLDVKQGIERDM